MKAILVIDMPNNCYDCQYCRFDARKYNFRGCVLTDTDVQDGTIDICKEVHSCCPLKPMPLKRETHVYWKSVGIGSIPTHEISDYDKGWNDCVDFLEGELND